MHSQRSHQALVYGQIANVVRKRRAGAGRMPGSRATARLEARKACTSPRPQAGPLAPRARAARHLQHSYGFQDITKSVLKARASWRGVPDGACALGEVTGLLEGLMRRRARRVARTSGSNIGRLEIKPDRGRRARTQAEYIGLARLRRLRASAALQWLRAAVVERPCMRL